jgi:hypothetical protein
LVFAWTVCRGVQGFASTPHFDGVITLLEMYPKEVTYMDEKNKEHKDVLCVVVYMSEKKI